MAHDTNDHDSLTSTPPDRASGGDVTTTGVSSHDAAAHGGGHGGHGSDDTPDVSTLVDTNWRQLLLPVVIIIIVAILLWGPVTGAFQTRPSTTTPPPAQQTPGAGGNSTAPSDAAVTPQVQTVAQATTAPATATTAQQPPTATSAPPTALAVAPTVTQALLHGGGLAPTQTAVAQAGENGDVARVPVELDFAGTTFVIKPGDTLLPDWKPETEAGIATWIQGTVANHILYVPYSDQNAVLFQNSKPGDKIHLTMNTGQVFEFEVNLSERATNGPAQQEGQFTVTAAMSQDHAGVTLFLIGDPAPDRAVIQAEFTGTIQ